MVEPVKPEIPAPPVPASSPSAAPGLRCPWCSTPVESLEDATCGACGATLHGDPDIEIPGVTAIDGQHAAQAAQAAAPRKVRRSFGSLFVGRDDQIPPPSQAELPALAPPDEEVRREMLRLQLDAELADLAARAAAIAAERGVPLPGLPGAGSGPGLEAEGDLPTAPATATPGAPAAGDLPPVPAAAISEPGPGAPAPPPEAVPPAVESRPRRPRRRSARP
jgi:hypothetical protein